MLQLLFPEAVSTLPTARGENSSSGMSISPEILTSSLLLKRDNTQEREARVFASDFLHQVARSPVQEGTQET